MFKSSFLFSVVALLSLFSHLALAAPATLESAKTLYQQGRQSFDQKDYARASQLFLQSLRTLEEIARSSNDPQEKRRVSAIQKAYFATIAITFHWQKDYLSARSYYQRCVHADPPERYKQLCVRYLPEVEKRLAALSIETTPHNAALLLLADGSNTGRLPPRPHSISGRLPPRPQMKILVPSGNGRALGVTFVSDLPSRASSETSSNTEPPTDTHGSPRLPSAAPSKSSISQSTPLKQRWLVPGTFQVKISLPGYLEIYKTITLKAGARAHFSYHLQKAVCPETKPTTPSPQEHLIIDTTLPAALLIPAAPVAPPAVFQPPAMPTWQIALIATGAVAGAAVIALGAYGIYYGVNYQRFVIR